MLKQPRLILLAFLFSVLPGCAHKQRPVTIVPVGSKADMESSRLFDDVIASGRFHFRHYSLPMCTIRGPEGPCAVEAFVGGEANVDESRYTCEKLDKAAYVGHCLNGKLEGLSIANANGTRKHSKEAFLSYFAEGKIAYPALTSWVSGTLNFGMDNEEWSYGCVYFGKWDRSSERCPLFIQVYGQDLLTEANAKALRDGTFDLNHYRGKFLEFVEPK